MCFVCCVVVQVLKGGAKVDSVSGAGEQRLRSMVARHCKKSN